MTERPLAVWFSSHVLDLGYFVWCWIFAGWWFQFLFVYSPRSLGFHDPIWRAYCSTGLKPTTSLTLVHLVKFFKVCPFVQSDRDQPQKGKNLRPNICCFRGYLKLRGVYINICVPIYIYIYICMYTPSEKLTYLHPRHLSRWISLSRKGWICLFPWRMYLFFLNINLYIYYISLFIKYIFLKYISIYYILIIYIIYM